MAKFYEKYKKALEAHGYTVDEHGIVRDAYGNQAAGEDRFGNVNCSDPNITTICAAEDAKPKPKAKKKVEPIEDGD
jgi:DNA-binding LacI/PurR family transcriptional regulator